ncbi:hypothetical protein Y032_1390g3860 [Ancylostoma ceylanicum]|uniref:Uncharacterized protein n=1 Tax=Ancylostoma ceylanicum TaxID=53326 RepID=A0A016W586_9BILA|nr:hypothetical protein Y032_1390g3860 [Ancylostoma ceylanicum]
MPHEGNASEASTKRTLRVRRQPNDQAGMYFFTKKTNQSSSGGRREGKGLQPDSNQTLEAISARQGDDKGWDLQSGSKMFDEVHQMQGLTLEVLEKLTKTYEEMQRTSDEMKQTLRNIRVMVDF